MQLIRHLKQYQSCYLQVYFYETCSRYQMSHSIVHGSYFKDCPQKYWYECSLNMYMTHTTNSCFSLLQYEVKFVQLWGRLICWSPRNSSSSVNSVLSTWWVTARYDHTLDTGLLSICNLHVLELYFAACVECLRLIITSPINTSLNKVVMSIMCTPVHMIKKSCANMQHENIFVN